MHKCNNPTLRAHAQALRKSMTAEERHLWHDYLKDLPISIRRQKVIGTYILDFYIPSYKLAIELDGAEHFSYQGHCYDDPRTKYLSDLGITVLRYSNYEIAHNFSSVCHDISRHIKTT